MMVARLLLQAGNPGNPGNAPPVPNFPGGNPAKDALALGSIIGIVVGAVGAVVIVFVVIWCIHRRLKSDSPEDERFLENLQGLPPRYLYKDLEHATNKFEKALGGGGFGTVYEGKLPNGVHVAVKVLNRQIGSQDFRAEVATVGGIHHINLVRLLGFCAQGSHRLLVYEFIPNGSLDQWIFSNGADDDGSAKLLDWSQRFEVAVGTARGLAYLHHECSNRIIHFDVKPQNILLDERFVAKIADFGLSQISERNVSTDLFASVMRGTPGYVAPEWLLGLPITDKGDVYSYGLVLFELIGGKRNLGSGDSSGNSYFPSACLKEVKERGFVRGCLSMIVDPKLNGQYDEEQANRMLKVAFWCIQESTEARPDMREVVLMLEGKIQIGDPPFTGLYHRINSFEREKFERQALGGNTVSLIERPGESSRSDSGENTVVLRERSGEALQSDSGEITAQLVEKSRVGLGWYGD